MMYRSLLVFALVVALGGMVLAAPDLAGTYKNEKLSLVLENDPTRPDHYTGTLTLGERAFKVEADSNRDGLKGQFFDGDKNPFPLSGVRENDTLTITSGKATYALTMAKRPGPGPRNPLDNQPGPNPDQRGPRDPRVERPAVREGGDYTVKTDNMIFQMYPDLKTAPAPAWVKPGVRITMYNASASIPGARDSIPTEDPNGDLVDKNGRKYRMDQAASASGHGFTQLDVVSLHKDVVAVDWRMYLIDGANGPAFLTLTSGGCYPPGACVDWWSNPDVLKAHAGELNGQGVRSAKVSYKAMNRQFNALWIGTTTTNGSVTTVVDLDGGLLLHAANAAYDPTGTAVVNGVTQNVGGMTNLGQSTLVNFRELKIPWAGGELPEQVQKVRRLVYEGVDQSNLSGTVMTTRHQWVVKVLGHGSDFLQYKMDRSDEAAPGFPAQNSSVEAISAVSQLTPLFIHPQHLAQLRQGQELDKDPITKVVTTVSFAGRDPRAGDVAVISQSNDPGKPRADFVYDRTSGWLISLIISDPNPLKISRMQLNLKSRD